jgi:hypothetical protein
MDARGRPHEISRPEAHSQRRDRGDVLLVAVLLTPLVPAFVDPIRVPPSRVVAWPHSSALLALVNEGYPLGVHGSILEASRNRVLAVGSAAPPSLSPCLRARALCRHAAGSRTK